MGLKNSSKDALSANLTALLDTRSDVSRLNLSKMMGVADGTLGRIKYGTGNPTIEVLDQIASFFRVPSWTLLRPTEDPAEESPSLSFDLLSKAISITQEGFQQAKRVPSNEQLAAAITYVYSLLLRGEHLDAATLEVEALIERAAAAPTGQKVRR